MKKNSRSLSPKLKIFLVIAAGAAFMGSFAWIRLEIVRISYDIHRLEKLEQQARDDVNKVTLKINEARSPVRLERIAREKFDMKKPRPEQVIKL
ncbi:MAG TPA: hypothetical protein PLH57_07975 [Oligoflexia bacterium]|nr:hypothetical protein [Oligoflexia bacterium]